MSQNHGRGKYRGGGESYRGRQHHNRGQSSDVRPSGYGSEYSEGPSCSESDQRRRRGYKRGGPKRGGRGQGFRGNHRGKDLQKSSARCPRKNINKNQKRYVLKYGQSGNEKSLQVVN